MIKIIAIITIFCIGYLLGYRKGCDTKTEELTNVQDSEYIEEYLKAHKEYIK